LSSPTVSTKLQWIAEQAEACRVAKSCARVVRTLVTEEPDVLIGHVRICGGLAGNRWVYPAADRPQSEPPADAGVMRKKDDYERDGEE
jgi:hypothetical protein